MLKLTRTWKKHQRHLAPGQSPLSSFLEHPKFQSAVESSNFQIWLKKGMSQFCKLGKDAWMYWSEQIDQLMGNSPIIQLQIEQIRNVIKELASHSEVFHPLTNFELFLGNVGKKKKILSNLYRILLATAPICNRMQIDWGSDLGIILSDAEWYQIQKFNLTFSTNVAIRENRYKLINRWYFTPVKLAKMSVQPDLCRRCGYGGADYFHMW